MWVRLQLPEDTVFSFDNMGKLDKEVLDYITDDCDFDKVFGIAKGIDFLDYSSSCKLGTHLLQVKSYPSLMTREEKNYEEEISDLFSYDMVKRDGSWIIDFKIDEIMQHTAVAFPNIILLKKEITEIQYTIRSKHMANIISGTVTIKERA